MMRATAMPVKRTTMIAAEMAKEFRLNHDVALPSAACLAAYVAPRQLVGGDACQGGLGARGVSGAQGGGCGPAARGLTMARAGGLKCEARRPKVRG
eukprot:1276049-Prymnesium_polylepis.1